MDLHVRLVDADVRFAAVGVKGLATAFAEQGFFAEAAFHHGRLLPLGIALPNQVQSRKSQYKELSGDPATGATEGRHPASSGKCAPPNSARNKGKNLMTWA
jgi:hypothetical protein